MTEITQITVNDEQVLTALRNLAAKGVNMQPLFRDIGETLMESTKQRFETSTAPDGSRWAANSAVTIAAQLANHSKTRNKNGSLSAKGRLIVANKKPLVSSGVMADTIRYAASGDGVSIGTNRFSSEITGGAAVLQFGTGRAGRGGAVTIPARPFLGFSESDKTEVMAIIHHYLAVA
ncbi:MAG: phage virion morphogenesis protein [Candidatus Pacebacteria bacterium]|nr:phage virion morphogenesis protein [Candidatus Paceibacterota bacterium]